MNFTRLPLGDSTVIVNYSKTRAGISLSSVEVKGCNGEFGEVPIDCFTQAQQQRWTESIAHALGREAEDAADARREFA